MAEAPTTSACASAEAGALRIAFVTMQLGGGYVHGTERYVGSLGGALREKGHEIVYLAGDPRGRGGRGELGATVDAERDIRAHPARGWTAVHGVSIAHAKRWLSEWRPDLVHLASPCHVGVGVALGALELGIPVVATAMDFWWVCPRATLLRDGERICDGTPDWQACLACVLADHPRPWLRRFGAGAPLGLGLLLASNLARGGSPAEALRWTRRRALLADVLERLDAVIFPSPATRDAVAPRLRHDRTHLIAYGLAPHFLERPRAERTNAPAADDLVIGFAGSLQSHKGAHLLLEALRSLDWRRTRVRVAGTEDDPSYWSRLQSLAEGLSVEFTGALAPDAMPGFLRSLDLFVLPSRWPENLPFALLEAQAAGLPVIASDVPGVSHRIGDSRRLFEPGSSSDLARALREFAGAPERADATPPVSSLAEMTEATEAVYRGALARRRRQRRRQHREDPMASPDGRTR